MYGERNRAKCVTMFLPNGEERHIVFIKKKKETNKKYPREYSLISEKPL